MISNDGLIEILVGVNVGSVIFPPLAWSVVNAPTDALETRSLFRNLYNSPSSNHLCLCLHRQRKKDKLASFSSLSGIDTGWGYLDTVSIFYQRPSSSSNNGLLPLAELGHLLTKGDSPEVSNSAWFNYEVGNATNFWDVEAADGIDDKDDFTYFQKFSSQMNLILMSMCRPLEYRKFAYLCDVDKKELRHIHNFCKGLGVSACLYAETDTEARKMIEQVNNY